MTINHIDQLAQWWETAEDAPASPGDRIIERHVFERDEDTYYTIGVHREGMRGLIGKSGTRILARAPKPEPAWHDAVAVIASKDYCERQVWERDTTYENRWYGTAGDKAVTSDLRVVTPLIEAKVTDEMVVTALDYYYGEDGSGSNEWHDDILASMRRALTAALGLEAK